MRLLLGALCGEFFEFSTAYNIPAELSYHFSEEGKAERAADIKEYLDKVDPKILESVSTGDLKLVEDVMKNISAKAFENAIPQGKSNPLSIGKNVFGAGIFGKTDSGQDGVFGRNTLSEETPVPFNGNAVTEEQKLVADKITEIENRPISEAEKAAKMEEVMQAVAGTTGTAEVIAEAEKFKNIHKEKTIRAESSEEDRYNILKDTNINIKPYNEQKLQGIDIEKEISGPLKKARKKLKELGEKFGVFKEYVLEKENIKFSFSKNNFDESQNKQKSNLEGYAKMLTSTDDIVENAVLIEVHKDKYKGTIREDKTLLQTDVFLSAFSDGEDIVPVKMEVKEFKDKNNSLYVLVTLEKIKTDKKIETKVAGQAGQNGTPKPYPVSNIKIADIIAKIKPSDGDLLKYLPDEMLTAEQLEGKRKELEKNALKIEKLPKKSGNFSGLNTPPSIGNNIFGAGVEQHSYDYSNSFEQQIDDWKEGKISEKDTLVVGATPKVFQDIGFNALPMAINQTHVDYAVNGTKDKNYFYGMDIKKLPQALENPVAIISSKTQNGTSVVALVNLSVNGQETIFPVYIGGTGHQNNLRIDANSITSVHGRNNTAKLLADAINEQAAGNTSVFYYNKKEAQSLLYRAGLQLPGRVIPRDGFNRSIRKNGSPVKPKLDNVTERMQFKRWFGDWQKHTKSASKVVDEDGKPLVSISRDR